MRKIVVCTASLALAVTGVALAAQETGYTGTTSQASATGTGIHGHQPIELAATTRKITLVDVYYNATCRGGPSTTHTTIGFTSDSGSAPLSGGKGRLTATQAPSSMTQSWITVEGATLHGKHISGTFKGVYKTPNITCKSPKVQFKVKKFKPTGG